MGVGWAQSVRIVWGGGYEMQKCMRQDSVVEAMKHKHLLQG